MPTSGIENWLTKTAKAENLPKKLGYSRAMENTSNGMPQFSTAEFASNGAAMTCGACKGSINGEYFQVNRNPVCADCSKSIQAQLPKDSHAAFVRAIVFGIGGALLGFALYVIFALATGLVIGFVSLAVGFIVGKAMNLGSRGAGGRRYQLVAVLLTYLAVSLSAVPIALHQMRQHQQTQQAQAQSSAAQAPQPMNIAKAVGVLTLLGIASPFLDLQDPVHGLIGLVILFVGIRFAWRFTAGRRISVSGPYTPAAASVPAGVI
jgi:uncharacterized protein (DUF983 family)